MIHNDKLATGDDWLLVRGFLFLKSKLMFYSLVEMVVAF